MGDKFRKIFDDRLQQKKQDYSILFRRNAIFVEMLFSNVNTSLEIIEFIDNKTNKINVKADSKIDKDESISLLKKTKNLIQRDAYMLHRRYSISIEVHFEIIETFLNACQLQTIQKSLETENSSKWIKAINEFESLEKKNNKT